jgi:hypothetical protein
MSPATTVTLNNILNYNFGSNTYSPALPTKMSFGLSTTQVTAAGIASVTEPIAASGYARIEICNAALASVTGMAYSTKTVTLKATNVYAVGDPIVVAGINTGFTVTNVDGTWVCKTGTNATDVVFDVTNQPVGTTPQTITVGTVTSGNWTTSTTGTLSNGRAITFGTPSSAWGTILSVFIADSITRHAGNVLWYYTLNPSRVIGINSIESFAVGAVVVTM